MNTDTWARFSDSTGDGGGGCGTSLPLTILAAPNIGEIGVRVVEEVSGAVVDVMLDTDITTAAQLLSPRNFMNIGATAAAVACDCSGVYVETDY
jgi:hypothetical protein